MYLRTERILRFWKKLNRRLIVASVMYSVLVVGLLYKIPYEKLRNNPTLSWIHLLYFLLILLASLAAASHEILNKLRDNLKKHIEDYSPLLRFFNFIIDHRKRNKSLFLGSRISDLMKELRGYSYSYVSTGFWLMFVILFLPGPILVMLFSLIISLLLDYPLYLTFGVVIVFLVIAVIWIYYCVLFMFFSKRVYLDPLENMNPHILISGTSGTGKSSLLKAIIADIILKLKKPVLALDFHDEFVEEIAKLNGKVFHMDEISINVFELTDSPRRHISMLIGLIHGIIPLGQIQQYTLENILYNLYQQRGIVEEDPRTWNRQAFTSQDLMETVQTMMKSTPNKKDQDSLVGLYRRLDTLFGSNIFGSKTDIPFKTIVTTPCCIALGGVKSESTQQFLVEMILRRLYFYMLQIKRERDAIKLFVVLDEAPKIIPKTDDSIVNSIAAESRKYNIALCLGGQSNTILNKSIIQNSNTTIQFYSQEPLDLEYNTRLLAGAFEENPESDRRRHITAELLRSLNVFEFLIKNAVNKNPILCKLDPPWKRKYILKALKNYNLDHEKENESPIEIKGLKYKLAQITGLVKSSFRQKKPQEESDNLHKESEKPDAQLSNKDSSNNIIIDTIMRKLKLNGCMQKTQLLKSMNMSVRLFYDVIDQMKKQGLIEEVDIPLTDKKITKYIVRKVPNKSPIHFATIALIADHLSQRHYGFTIRDGPDSPDLDLEIGEKTVAVEVEMGKKKDKKEIINMLSRRLKKFGEIIIVTPPEEIEGFNQLANSINSPQQIHIMTLDNFFKFVK